MVIEILVKDSIEEGRAFLTALARAGFPMQAAFWKRVPDEGYWRLVIASQVARDNGPIEAYTQLGRVWDTLTHQDLSFNDITVLSPTDARYVRHRKELRYFPDSDPREKRVEDGYIYFIHPDEAVQKTENGASVVKD